MFGHLVRHWSAGQLRTLKGSVITYVGIGTASSWWLFQGHGFVGKLGSMEREARCDVGG